MKDSTYSELSARLAAHCGIEGAGRRIWAPYRLSPLGAHTDHQGGLTTGVTIDRGVALVGVATEEPVLHLHSKGMESEAVIPLEASAERTGDWTDYPRGVVQALLESHELKRGFRGVLQGDLPSGGIASSAALLAATLLALQDANGLRARRREDPVLLTRAEFLATGVQVGLLDSSVILNGRDECLVALDAQTGTVAVHRFPQRMEKLSWLLVRQGDGRSLRSSPYNERVEECRQAAIALGATGEPPMLREISPEVYRRKRKELDPLLLHRAEHFFSEHKRTRLGIQTLASTDAVAFGRLMTASGDSLRRDFDAGDPAADALLKCLVQTPGVLGANYAGGGFGGHLQALCRRKNADAVLSAFRARVAEQEPELAASVHAELVGFGGGASLRV